MGFFDTMMAAGELDDKQAKERDQVADVLAAIGRAQRKISVSGAAAGIERIKAGLEKPTDKYNLSAVPGAAGMGTGEAMALAKLSPTQIAEQEGLSPFGKYADMPQAQAFYKQQQTVGEQRGKEAEQAQAEQEKAQQEQKQFEEIAVKSETNFGLAQQMEKDFPEMAQAMRLFTAQNNWDEANKVVGQWYLANQRMKEAEKKDAARLKEIQERDAAGGYGGKVDPYKTAKFEQSLRKEIEANPAVKAFHTIDSQMGKLNAVWGDYVKGNQDHQSMIATDQAIVMIFNKLLDPTSVVRESEFARTPQASAVMERAKGYIPKLMQGGVGLTNRERQEIVNTANILYNAAQEGYQNKLNQYQQTVSQYGNIGVQPGRVIMPQSIEATQPQNDDPLGIF